MRAHRFRDLTEGAVAVRSGGPRAIDADATERRRARDFWRRELRRAIAEEMHALGYARVFIAVQLNLSQRAPLVFVAEGAECPA